MSILNKKYCSHCGSPNPRENVKCAKCGKPISSALRAANTEDDDEEVETVIIKKKRPVKATRIVYEDDDGEGFSGEIVIPSSSDVIIERPTKLTVGGLKNGAAIPTFGGGEALPADVEVSSRSYFHQENL